MGMLRRRFQLHPGMNGTQVWARELSDSSRLIGLLNLGGAENTFFGAIL